jgi:RNA 2',3'-cyclic 3'-phosphodiesterase
MVRLFLALELSGQQKHLLHNLQGKLKINLSGVRWVRPENMHLTVKYLGDIIEDLVETIKLEISEAVSSIEPFSIKYGECGVFPSPQKARVIWVGLKEGNGETLNLHEKVENTVVKLGLAPERRVYTPHLTLGRVRYQLSPPVVESIVAENTLFETDYAIVDGLVLFQSHLTKQGATYIPIYKANFKGNWGSQIL